MDDYSDKHYIEVSSEDLSRNWGIILEKARLTLDVMTQMNVCLYILPPTNRYQTDLLSQKLGIFSVKFYTETHFSDDILCKVIKDPSCTLIGTYFYMYYQ